MTTPALPAEMVEGILQPGQVEFSVEEFVFRGEELVLAGAPRRTCPPGRRPTTGSARLSGSAVASGGSALRATPTSVDNDQEDASSPSTSIPPGASTIDGRGGQRPSATAVALAAGAETRKLDPAFLALDPRADEARRDLASLAAGRTRHVWHRLNLPSGPGHPPRPTVGDLRAMTSRTGTCITGSRQPIDA